MKNKNNQGILPASPYIVWSALFIVIPLLIVVFFSFTVKSGDNYSFSLENFKRLIDPNYLKVFWRSLLLAAEATLGCLILGYPVAYLISKMREGKAVCIGCSIPMILTKVFFNVRQQRKLTKYSPQLLKSRSGISGL